MEDGSRVLPQASIEPYTTAESISFDDIYTQKIWEFDSTGPDFLSRNYFRPLYIDQLAHYSVVLDPHWEQYYWPSATGPMVLSPWHISGSSAQVTLTRGSDANPGDEIGGGLGFADSQIWANGLRPGRMRITSQEDYLRGTNLPFNQGNENDVRLCNPNPVSTTSDGQSPNGLSKYIQDTHPHSPFEHHPDQSVEAQESSGSQRIPETETEQGSSIKPTNPKEWPCGRDGCNKSYRRPQEVRRHVREGHEISPTCLICGIKWKRPEKIRRHLLKMHRDRFTKEERQTIRRLRGLNNTIDFFNEWEATN